jgi:hypothetical protein
MTFVEYVAKAKRMKGRSSGGEREVQVFIGSHMSYVARDGYLRVIILR